MRILALVTDAFGGFGGIAAYNRAFLSALAHQGATVTVLPRIGTAETLPEGIDQRWPVLNRYGYSASLIQLLARRQSVDFIWCGHLHMAPLAAFAGAFLRKPIWLQIHGIEAWSSPSRLLRAAADRAALTSAVSRYTRRRFLSWSQVEPERVRVLQNCVSDRFVPGPKRSEFCVRYGIEGRRVLLTIARLSQSEGYKGIDRVIKVMPQLARRFPGLTYVIGGDGDDAPRLKALALECGVAEHCRFIGRIADDEIVDHHRLADIFVMPSTGEGFGIVYLEAMACGVPAVGLDCDGSLDPLSSSALGRAVSEDCLAEALAELLTAPPPRPTKTPEDLEPFSQAAFAARVGHLAEEVLR